MSSFFCGVAVASTVEQIHHQLVEYYASSPVDVEQVQTYATEIQPGGTWSDIDYQSKRMGNWDTRSHLDRLVVMSQAYVSEGSPFFKNEALKNKIINGLQHWIDQDYQNPNWYNARIGVPERVLISFLLLEDELPESLLQQALPTVLNRTNISMTGQNKVWCSGIVLMRALLTDDLGSVQQASESIWEELRVSMDEGIQADWSFHQHGPQFQNGVYGLLFSDSMVMWGMILRDTSFSLSGEKLRVLRDYIFEGSAWLIWKGALDLNSCGRQIDFQEPIIKANMLTRQIRRMELLDDTLKDLIQHRLSENPNRFIGFKPFWRSDFSVFRQKEWMASLKMSSSRTIGCESCNAENVQGLHQADGTLLIYQNGVEYQDIQPLWDWNLLPGTTCDQGLNNLEPGPLIRGESDFAGVLGSENGGLAAMIYQRNDLTARKAWFFMPDTIICLGAGITGETKGKVITSVQQSWLSEEVFIEKQSIFHSGTGYQIIDGAMEMKKEPISGNWLSCFPTRGDRSASGKIFSLSINHGLSPNDESYAYKIFPNTTVGEFQSKMDVSDSKILQNTSSVQAVENEGKLHAVFYEAGSLEFGNVPIKVDAPCLLSLDGNQLSVADPLHHRSEINITINEHHILVALPQGEWTGKQVDLDIREER